MAQQFDSQLDVSILSVLLDDGGPRRWMSAEDVAHGLAALGVAEPPAEVLQQRLVLLLADGPAECRAQGRGLMWRRAEGAGRMLSNAGTWLSDEEALALQVLKRFAGRQITSVMATLLRPLFDAAESQLRRRSGEGGTGRIAWHRKVSVVERSSPLVPPRLREVVLLPVLTAVFEERCLEVVYRPRFEPESKRVLMPLGVVEKAGMVYLGGLEDEEPAPQCLRLDRVHAAHALKERFIYPDHFSLADYVEEAAEFGLHGDGNIKLAVRFAKGCGDIVRDAPMAPDQTEEIGPDGSLVVRCTVEMADWLVRWLRSFGPQVEVLEPVALRRALALEVKSMARAYCRN